MPSNIFHSRFYSRLTPGFAPDSGSNTISLHRTRSGKNHHVLNEIVTLRHTQSHVIAIGPDRPLKARALSLISIPLRPFWGSPVFKSRRLFLTQNLIRTW